MEPRFQKEVSLLNCSTNLYIYWEILSCSHPVSSKIFIDSSRSTIMQTKDPFYHFFTIQVQYSHQTILLSPWLYPTLSYLCQVSWSFMTEIPSSIFACFFFVSYSKHFNIFWTFPQLMLDYQNNPTKVMITMSTSHLSLIFISSYKVHTYVLETSAWISVNILCSYGSLLS